MPRFPPKQPCSALSRGHSGRVPSWLGGVIVLICCGPSEHDLPKTPSDAAERAASEVDAASVTPVACTLNGRTVAVGARWYVGTQQPSRGSSVCDCTGDAQLECVESSSLTGDEANGCRMLDRVFPVGTSWYLADSCTECRCLDDGGIECGETDCRADAAEPPADGCRWRGVQHALGAAFEGDVDGCSQCRCDADDHVRCEEVDCEPRTAGCVYMGALYEAGASIPLFDGCNTGTCNARGIVETTLIACF